MLFVHQLKRIKIYNPFFTVILLPFSIMKKRSEIMIAIKQLTIENVDELLKMRKLSLSQVFEEEKKEMSDEEWSSLEKETRLYYLEELEANRHIAVAAYEGEELLGWGGMCLHREMPSPDNMSGQSGYLMNIYTKKQHRGKGVGKAICRHLIRLAKKIGIDKIYLESTEEGKHLYRRLGFQDMEDYMKL